MSQQRHPGGIHIVACVDKDGVTQSDHGKLHYRFKQTGMLALMFWLCKDRPTIVGSHVVRSYGGRAPGKRTIMLTRGGRLPQDMSRDTLLASSISDALSLCATNEKVMVAGGLETFATFLPLADVVTILMLDTESIVPPDSTPIRFPEWSSIYLPGVTDRWRLRPDGGITHIEIVKNGHKSYYSSSTFHTRIHRTLGLVSPVKPGPATTRSHSNDDSSSSDDDNDDEIEWIAYQEQLAYQSNFVELSSRSAIAGQDDYDEFLESEEEEESTEEDCDD